MKLLDTLSEKDSSSWAVCLVPLSFKERRPPMYRYDQEFYFRSIWYIKDRIKEINELDKNQGRNLPSVIRKGEEFYIPGHLKARESLAFVTLLIALYPEADYQVSKVLQLYINQGRIHKYEGEWRWVKSLIQYFDVSPVGYDKNINDREFTIYSQPDYFDFLLTLYSADDLFGNMYNLCSRLSRLIKVRKERTALTPKPVKRIQRHRGYRDHGHLPEINSSALRFANQSFEIQEETKYDILDQTHTWGLDPEKAGGD